MKKAIAIAFVLSVIASCGWAQPKVGLGLKFTRNMQSWGEYYMGIDSTIYETWSQEWFWGIGGDLVIDFTRLLTLRMGAVEYNFISNRAGEGNGGTGLSLFSNLNADLIFVLPFGRRISPLVFAGLTYERFYHKPMNDLRAYASPYNIRLGFGGRYLVTDKIRLLLDSQAWDNTQSGVDMGDGFVSWGISELLGLARANLGVHYQF
jgi:hypothetical protein